MKKMKVFFVAAALVLVTAGVFAGKSKFADTYILAYLNGTTYVPVVEAPGGSIDFVAPFTTTATGNTQVKISTFPVFYYGQGSPNVAFPLYF